MSHASAPRIELLGDWSFTPRKQPGWLPTTVGSVGVHQANGTLELRSAAAGAPVLAAIALPPDARVALDPRAELVAYLADAQVRFTDLRGAQLHAAMLAPDLAVEDMKFRRGGEQLWVFGATASAYHALVFDRRLALLADHTLDLGREEPASLEALHPTRDDFVLTVNVGADDPDEATTDRIGVVSESGKLRVAFTSEGVDHPCIGFTPDGASLIGVDFSGVRLHGWPAYDDETEAGHPEGYEGGLNGIVVGSHLLTERHEEDNDETTSALLVVSLATLRDEATIPWAKRGPFGQRTDNAGLDLHASLGGDTFLELSPRDKKSWCCRIWRLVTP